MRTCRCSSYNAGPGMFSVFCILFVISFGRVCNAHRFAFVNENFNKIFVTDMAGNRYGVPGIPGFAK